MGVGPLTLTLDLRHWVNDLLMALFFFVVGLEIKRELVAGELRGVRRAALPAAAALGGMVVPALLYLLINPGVPASRGWGIPIATDIAFALGLLALLARGAPLGLRVFLLALAIVDDIGAVIVIAIFYSGAVDLRAVALSLGAVVLFRAAWSLPPALRPAALIPAAIAWLALLAAGVHPTLAGVALGLTVPAAERPDSDGHSSPAARLQHRLHPYSAFAVVPIFALANAGVTLPRDLASAAAHPVTAGIVLGLVVGKIVGITLATFALVQLRIAALPAGVTWIQIVGTAALAGIGFTVSLFIVPLAFQSESLIAAAKLGVLSASLIAATLGGILLTVARRRPPGTGISGV